MYEYQENGYQFYIPVGYAHGFLTLEPYSEIIYKCSDYYSPATEGSLFWKDPDTVEWFVANKFAPSPEVKPPPKPLINGSTDLTCFAAFLDPSRYRFEFVCLFGNPALAAQDS